MTFIERLPGLLIGLGELGTIYAIMALGVFISFRTLNTPDLTVDGSFVLGAAVCAIVTLAGHPVLGLIIAFLAGAVAGAVTSLLNTKMGIQPLLAGILVMFGLYSINLWVMGNKPNLSLSKVKTIYNIRLFETFGKYNELIASLIILSLVLICLFFFLKTRFGFVLRATGDNEHMVRASGVDTDFTKLVGLSLSNGLVGLTGALIAQYSGFADVQMGTGMVVIGLASVIIGEVIFGTKTLFRRLIAVVLGSLTYRIIIALAYEINITTSDLKLISAVIVGLALSAPKIGGGWLKLKKRFVTSDSGGEGNA